MYKKSIGYINKIFLNIILIFLFSFSQAYTSEKALLTNTIAPSVCANFINKIFDNYGLIEKHDIANYSGKNFGIYIKKNMGSKYKICGQI